VGENLWTVSSNEEINKNLRIFELEKDGVEFQTYIDGIENCGRYF